jgi:integrase
MAARTAAYGKAAYGWAVKRGALFANPFLNLPERPTERRERVVTDDELAAIWRATDTAGPFNGIVRLLVLTGQRREEVAGMTWAELSDDLSTWTFPPAAPRMAQPISFRCRHKHKTCCATSLGLGAPAIGLELVFPGLRGPFNGWSKAKAALDAKSGVTNWRLHDVRRTAEARGSPRSYGTSSQPCVRQPCWHYRGLPAPRFCLGKARGLGCLGRARARHCRGARGNGQRGDVASLKISRLEQGRERSARG